MVRPYLYLHPGMCTGRPTINGSRLYVQVVAEVWWSGEIPEKAIYKSWPNCKGRPELLLACWWMARYGPATWRRRWREWLERAAGELWWSNYDIDLPPQKARSLS